MSEAEERLREGPLLHTAVVVLAAGGSKRLGTPKQLAQIGGVTLLGRTLSQVMRLGEPRVFVVLGGGEASTREAMAREVEAAGGGAEVVWNERAAEGLSTSLRCGLDAARAVDPRLWAVLFTLCDQPGMDGALLERLLDAVVSGPASIAASSYAGVLGVPAVFTRAVFGELEALTGDQGAREVVRRDPARVRAVVFEEGAQDIDTHDELDRATRAFLS
ncbi:nucleotidyltransferase family protein [Chondromyces crocatus]|uniref:4-diphosphocytidyl-2C-methyl-D-erythritol synthase n=1 Tax=Chondromyces crocatus TaxID=52 RepID=A0A0K1EU07_CHOCO|nr:nucleotidyltransferase family protein [Chondromyces crocatus]AKT44103.1 4-diphosphocytidyl-2C-methyl-D-erythritol synthase [Chondromyces crocatus]